MGLPCYSLSTHEPESRRLPGKKTKELVTHLEKPGHTPGKNKGTGHTTGKNKGTSHTTGKTNEQVIHLEKTKEQVIHLEKTKE